MSDMDSDLNEGRQPTDSGSLQAGNSEVPPPPKVLSRDSATVGSPGVGVEDYNPLAPTRMLVLGGAVLLLVSFFVPWWSISIRAPRTRIQGSAPRSHPSERTREEWTEVAEILDYNYMWYTDHMPRKRPPRIPRGRLRESCYIFGWNCGTGIMGLIFSLLIIAIVILPMPVPRLRKWSWTGSFVSAALGVPLFILALVWWFGSPGENTDTLLSQGVILGPFVTLGASIIIIAAGVFEGVSGLKLLLKKGLVQNRPTLVPLEE